jgi:hypothetical protein
MHKELTLPGIPDSYTIKFDGVHSESVLELVEDLPDPEVLIHILSFLCCIISYHFKHVVRFPCKCCMKDLMSCKGAISYCVLLIRDMLAIF